MRLIVLSVFIREYVKGMFLCSVKIMSLELLSIVDAVLVLTTLQELMKLVFHVLDVHFLRRDKRGKFYGAK